MGFKLGYQEGGTIMKRREFLKGVATASAAIALPSYSPASNMNSAVLKFIPGSSPAVLDPIANTAAATRAHGYMVFDTLYGLDENYQPHPQMVEGHTISDDKKTWVLKLREGLKFHDGEPVLARDAVASIDRWMRRDSFGAMLRAATDEVSATSDREITIRLKKPFPLLPAALGKVGSFMPAIMPERLAKTDPAKPVEEIIGSGPYRFLASEYNPNAFLAYKRFEDYVPRSDGPFGHSSGPKVAHFERVEWHIIPDPATALTAIQSGEIHWWERPLPDFIPVLESHPDLQIVPSASQVCFLRLNHLTEPFNNAAIRRLTLSCIDQKAIMQAVGGSGRWSADLGIYTGSMRNDAGMEKLAARKDWDNIRAELKAAGYKGERLVMLVATDLPAFLAASQVGAEIFRKMGFNVEFQTMDWATASQRRTSREPLDKGGWSCFFVLGDSDYFLDQASNFFVRGAGEASWFGWPTSSRLEELNQKWFDAATFEEQLAIAKEIQLQAWEDVPYIPCGEVEAPGVATKALTGFRPGFAKLFDVRPA
jgi:peptide/nickel transport system substrate-binding protein